MEKNIIVFASAGHGGNDPGATACGMKEKDINLQILLSFREVLVRHGIKVVCSRLTDENDPVTQEVEEANKSGADIAISFHTNADGGEGSESLYHGSSVKGKKLAELCEKHTKEIGQNSRGIKVRNDLWFLRGTEMPAVICECAFIDNDVDNDIIDSLTEQKAFGVAYAKAILEYLGIVFVDGNIVPQSPSYTFEQFVCDVQEATGSKIDGVPGSETIGNTVTVSRTKNKYHKVVTALERRLKTLGFYSGSIEADKGKTPNFGKGMETAVNEYQKQILGYKNVDGEITAKGKMWKSLLGMI